VPANVYLGHEPIPAVIIPCCAGNIAVTCTDRPARLDEDRARVRRHLRRDPAPRLTLRVRQPVGGCELTSVEREVVPLMDRVVHVVDDRPACSW
jgi:hypothetical protein